jgi:type III secretion protein S
MHPNPLANELYAVMRIVLTMTMPPLVGAVVVGLLIGVLQAATQIQDQSAPLTFKLMAVLAVVIFAGPSLTLPLLRETIYLLDHLAAFTR